MIQLVNQNGKIQYNICEYVIDTYDDLQFVPIHNMGSKVFIIDTGDTYILSGDQQWILQPTQSGGSGGTPSYIPTITLYDIDKMFGKVGG